MPVQASEVAAAERRLKDLRRAYLKGRGWSETCHVPGGFWMWEKTVPEWGHLMGDMESATQMEFWLIAAPETKPNEE